MGVLDIVLLAVAGEFGLAVLVGKLLKGSRAELPVDHRLGRLQRTTR